MKTSTCIDLIFTNVPDLCSKAVSKAIGCSDHNLIAVSRKTKLPKSGARIIQRRSFQRFNPDSFLTDIKNIQWKEVCDQNDVNIALQMFMDELLEVVNKHAPIRKRTVRSNSAPWVDSELRSLMLHRDKAKDAAQKLGNYEDWKIYRKLRNQVTKLNQSKKKKYFQQKLCDSAGDSRKLWKTLNVIMCKRNRSTPNFVEVEGKFFTRPADVANYFNDFFSNKVNSLRTQMSSIDNSYQSISDLMQDKTCHFNLETVNYKTVEKLLNGISEDTSPGIDNLDGKIIKVAARMLTKPICHIFNCSIISGEFPDLWKQSKIIPLPKDGKLPFTGSNCRPINLLPILSKLLEK